MSDIIEISHRPNMHSLNLSAVAIGTELGLSE